MDLEYPSQKRNNLSQQLNKMDRRYGSIILSNPKISASKTQLPPRLKKKVLEYVAKDQANRLYSLMKRQCISVTDEISKDGLGWTMLHYIAKGNSIKCMDMCLRKTFQEDAKDYPKVVNVKTAEEDTPLLLACQFRSNQVIKIILNYGGADIYTINSRKQSAYQLALSYGNEEILQILMKYELKVKRRNSINTSLLQQPLKIEKQQKCLQFFHRLCKCLCWNHHRQQNEKDTETDRKMIKSDNSPDEFLGQLEISWLDPEVILHSKLPLFAAISSPFSIRQSSMIVSNLLVVFQGLAEHPDLLKNIIFKNDTKYYVRFSHNLEHKIVWIDAQFPYFQETFEPLFLSLEDQIWPMVLQKALSQYYNGYFQPGKIPIDQLLYNITGNHCFKMEISSPKNSQHKEKVKNQISKLLNSNCIHILKSKPESQIKTDQGRIQSFSILKIIGDHILINCPFISQKIRQKQEKQTRQMKLLKSHYSNVSGMAMWMTLDEFFENFQEIVFCRAETSHAKEQSLKISLCSKRIFMRFKTAQKVEKSLLTFSFLSNMNGRSLAPKSTIGWKIRNSQKQIAQKIECDILGSVSIDCLEPKNQFLFLCEFNEDQEFQPSEQIMMVYRDQSLHEVEALDAILGDLQFIQCCKKYFNAHHTDYEAPIIEKIGQYVLIMAVSNSPCYIPLVEGISQENIVQGMLTQGCTKLEMFQYKNIKFAVLMNISEELSSTLKIISFESNQNSSDAEQS